MSKPRGLTNFRIVEVFAELTVDDLRAIEQALFDARVCSVERNLLVHAEAKQRDRRFTGEPITGFARLA